jgi:DNA polymerase III subunit gamma/tau
MENVWYNEYRPKKFEDVLGQDLAVTVLSNAIITKRVKNGYLLSGSRGVGKTTLARIFANNLNSIDKNPQANIDIYEMDAASNTSVDDVRLLIENASTPPLVGDYKVFIIDEVHMLSKSAMNALLKILEEPPVYLVFVFATTNPEKILPTILSRLIKLDLNNHTIEDLEKNLKRIANDKSMNIDDKSINLIAKKANGGQRDAINYLQTLNEYNLEEYNISNVSSILGVLPDELVKSIIYTVKSSNVTLEYKKNLISVIQKLQISPIAMINQILEDLLDKHFNSNTENSDLIAILADYVTLNLPVTNLIEVIAYLDLKYITKKELQEVSLNQQLNIIVDKKKELTEDKLLESKVTESTIEKVEIKKQEKIEIIDQIEQSEPTIQVSSDHFERIEKTEIVTNYNVLENDIEFQNVENNEIINDRLYEVTPSSDVIVNSNIINNSEVNLVQINKILQNLPKDKKAPTKFVNNITNFEILLKDNIITLSKKMKLPIELEENEVKYLEDKINGLIDNPVVLSYQYDKKINPVTIENKTDNIAPVTTSNESNEKIFYSVYNKRPKNVDENVPIITDPIPDPEVKVENDEDSGVHDLFDL